MLQAFLLALAFALAAASIQEVAAIPAQAFLQAPVPMLPPKVVQPDLCQDGTKQYSGYLPNSPLFFWFFESRSDPSNDPIGIWLNGGPGSSSLTGMDANGACEVVWEGEGQSKVARMRVRNESWTESASMLVIDNPRSTGFSLGNFPASHSAYQGAADLYAFMQSFLVSFPQYSDCEIALNSLSYGGHYVPIYAGYILHRNALLAGKNSLYSDIYPDKTQDIPEPKGNKHIRLESVSIGNGWINPVTQFRSNVDFACGGAADRGIPMLSDNATCAWAYKRLQECERLMGECNENETKPACVGAGLYCESVTDLPYTSEGYNPYDYRIKEEYDETAVVSFYSSAKTQAALGVIAAGDEAIKWQPHNAKLNVEYHISGDALRRSDHLVERMMRSGVDVLKYEGMVDWICNFIGVRRIMASLPNYAHQSSYNSASMTDWSPFGMSAGAYKCVAGGKGEGKLCYVEIDDAGHIAAKDKPRELARLMREWMKTKAVL